MSRSLSRSLRATGTCAVACPVPPRPPLHRRGPGRARRSDPTGFHLAGFLNGSALQVDGEDVTESGPGAGLAVGYGFSRTVTLYLEAAGASVQMADLDDTYALAHVDLGIRLNLRGPRRGHFRTSRSPTPGGRRRSTCTAIP